MSEFLVQQFLLHTAPYKETSALVTGFSKELGKIRFVAKGIRSEKNKYKGLAQSFTLLSTRLVGRGELKSGVAMEALQPSIRLSGISLFCGMYCNEVLVRILPLEEPCPDIFIRYHQLLCLLTEVDNPEPLLREFELFLLSELGSSYDFERDSVSNEIVQADCHYRFVVEQGFCLTQQGNNQGNFKGSDLLAIAMQHWTPESLKAAKRFCRMALSPWLGKKPLKSRELFVRQN